MPELPLLTEVELQTYISDAETPEEALSALTEMGIDWYVTEGGDLMIKYWQVGARGFMTPEHSAEIRVQQDPPDQAVSLEWLSENLDALQRQYAGQWIAVLDETVAVAAPDIASLLSEVRRLGIEKPFVTQIPVGDVVWQTAFASGH